MTAEALLELARLREHNLPSPYNQYEKYKAVRFPRIGVDATITYEFGVYFADILSSFILKDNRYILSPEQEELINKYLIEADTGLVTDELIQLDEFLGSLKESLNG
jgi:hypothetical protein